MIQSPEDPPEDHDETGTELERDQVDTSAPDRRLVSGAPTPAEDPQVQHALDAARRHAELLRAEGVDVVGVYLTGSAAIGDRWPHSDIDTVTVTREAVEDAELLGRVHDQLAEEFSTTHYDTTYVPYAWLAAPPADATVAPHSVDGELHLDRPAPIHPVTWLELATSITADGVPREELPVEVDLDEVASYTRVNLSSYWAKVAQSLSAAAEAKPADAPLVNPTPVVWTVLGAPRLAAMLDRIRRADPDELPRLVSKTEAGDWVRTHLPLYADLAERSLAHRHGRDASFTVGDAAAAAAMVPEVIMVANSR